MAVTFLPPSPSPTHPNMVTYYKVCDAQGRTRNGSFKYNLGVGEVTRDHRVDGAPPMRLCERGLHFTTQPYVLKWASGRGYTHVFTVEPTGDVDKDEDKAVCMSLRTTGPLRSLHEFVNEDMDENQRLEILKFNGMSLHYVNDQTPEMCRMAVWQNGRALQYIRDQTPEICLRRGWRRRACRPERGRRWCAPLGRRYMNRQKGARGGRSRRSC